MRYTRRKSKCTSCPLWRGSEKTAPGIGPAGANLILLGEAPGTYEISKRLPFQGRAGDLLDNWLKRSKIVRHHTYITNVICCQPPGNNMSTTDAQVALERCREGLLEELEYVALSGATLVPMGQTAWEAIFPDGKYDRITYARGGVYDWKVGEKRLVVVPTLHPQFYGYNEHSLSSFAVWEADGRKVKRISGGGRIVYRPKDYNIFPSISEAYLCLSIKDRLICVDTETDSKYQFEAGLKLFGFAWGESDAMCISFGKDGFNGNGVPIKEKISTDLLANNKQVYQNVIYDAIVMEENGIPFHWENLKHDVMVLSHTLNPELRHNLGAIGSLYADIPYHKNMRGSDNVVEQRTYNADDCTAPLRCLPNMLKELKDRGLEDLYYNERMKVLKPLARMIQRGVKLDKKKLKKWTEEQQELKDAYEKDLRTLGKLPDGFSLSSASHLRLFLFQDRDAQFDRAEKKLQERLQKIADYKNTIEDINQSLIDLYTQMEEISIYTKKKKKLEDRIKSIEKKIDRTTTAKCHKELVDLVSLLSIKPLYPAGSFQGRKTKKKREMKTDEQNLLSFRNYLNRKLRDLKTPTKRKEVETLLDWIALYTKYTRVGTLISNYSTLGKWVSKKDGRIHCSINPNGTRTGRISFSDPNLGTLPKKRGKSLREALVAEDGYVFVSADYSNAEFIGLAYICKDPGLIEIVQKNLNIHDENTKNVFNIGPDHPEWSKRRAAMKTYQFGRIQYGGSDKEIYQKIMIENPDLKMTFSEFCEMNDAYFKVHPVQRRWIEETQRIALEQRITKTPMGFTRTLYGSERDIIKQAINTPVQGCIAHLINRAMIRIEDKIEEWYKSGWLCDTKMILQIYDQLIFEVPKGRNQYGVIVDKLIELVRYEMQKPVDIYGTMVSFPVDISIGDSLGTLKEKKTVKK